MASLYVENLSFSYDSKKIVDDISLTVNSGEITCLLGPSGCGKSTILKLIAGLEEMKSGKILLGDGDLTNLPAEQRKVGLVFQNPSLFPHLTAKGNIDLAIKGKKYSADHFLKSVGMSEYANYYPNMLSSGQQQRVAIARSLANNPKVMLLDEPFANLDSILRANIRQESLALLAGAKIPVLLITHDPEEALSVADKIYVMQEGKIIQYGAPQELYNDPRNNFIASFFGAGNILQAKVTNKKLQTKIGEFDAKNFEEGQLVNIYIRPEFVNISSGGTKNIDMIVENIRFLGLTSIIYLRVKNNNVKLISKVLSKKVPKIGEKVKVKIDKAFLFEA